MFLIYLSIFWLIGIWFGDTAIGQTLPDWALGCAAFVGFVGAYMLRKVEPTSFLLLACISMFCLGGLRAQLAEPELSSQHIVRLNNMPRAVTLTGIVVAEPDVGDTLVDLRVQVDSATWITSGMSAPLTEPVEGVVLVTANRFPKIEYGARVTVTGKLEEPFESAEFSYKQYLAREGIHSTMFWPRVEVSAENQGNLFYTSLLQFKANANATISRIVPAPESAVLQAMLFGDRTFLPDRLLEDYRTVGLSHTIVVSGFHVSIIMLLVLEFTQLFTTPRWSIWMTLLLLSAYAVIVGLKPAVLRAILMSMAFLLGYVWLGRRSSALAISALVAFLLTVVDPKLLSLVSFQLSFSAVLSLILYSTSFRDWMQTRLKLFLGVSVLSSYLSSIITILAMTLSAQLLTLPLVAWYFGQISLISIIANVIVVPFLPIIMILGSIATFLGMVVEPLGSVIGWFVWLPLRYTITVVELFARVPFASVPVQVSTFSVGVIYFVIGVVSWYRFQEVERRIEIWEQVTLNLPERSLAGVSVCAALLAIGWHNSQPDGMLHVTFFDVGQGDATLIESPSGRQILVDAGLYPSVINSHLGRAIPFWDRTIDMVIATHPDADHVAGMPEVLARYQVDHLLVDGLHEEMSAMYVEMLGQAELQHLTPTVVQAGQVIEIGDGVRLEIVHPSETLDDEIRNNNSISMRLVYGDFSLLLTGDVEESAESAILARNLPLQSIVYKAGHHGSNTSSTPAFLNAVHPQIAVVSAGAGNRFGHPHPEVMARFVERGVTVLCTSQFGSIEVITDGRQMWWEGTDRPKTPNDCSHATVNP